MVRLPLILLVLVLIGSAACHKTSPLLKGWPHDIPQYPGSTVDMANDLSFEELTFLQVMLVSSDSVSVITDYYERIATESGYERFYLLRCKDWTSGAYVKGKREFNFMCSSLSGANRVLLRVMSPAAPIEHYSQGSTSAVFPLLELSPYPDAIVETAAARENEAVLIMETIDSFDEVSDHYIDLYETQGFSVNTEPVGGLTSNPGEGVVSFQRGDLEITMIVSTSLAGNALALLRAHRSSH